MLVNDINDVFIQKAQKIHNYKYDYSLVKCKNSKTKIQITCPTHGIFEQVPYCHLIGQGCPRCCGKNKTTETFISEALQIHRNKYDYSLVNYLNATTKVIIICPVHGQFLQSPHMHLRNINCPQCSITYRKSSKQFIEDAKIIHKDKYDYSLVNYVNNVEKVIIVCKIHGEFNQSPASHLNGAGCPICSSILKGKNRRKSNENFIKEASIKHNNKYDYSLVNYVTTNIKVKIICPDHGIFEQMANSHLQSSGCPICKESKGEKEIRNILTENNVEYEINKRFENCSYIRTLPFDFYLPYYNVCIEYDGIQHFELNSFFTNQIEFENQQKRDKIKNQYCYENGIKLIRIKYDENIRYKLKELL